MYTYQALIRKYSDDVARKRADLDLSPRQRRITVVLLNVASNNGNATVVYPPTDSTRELVVKALHEAVWHSRCIAEAASPGCHSDLDVAVDRAVEVLRNL